MRRWEKWQMRRRIFHVSALGMLLACTLHAQDLASTWQGTLKSDSDQRRLQLQIAKSDKGVWEATALNIEFVHDDLHVDSLVLNGSDLKFTISGRGEFHGKISADGASIQGTLTFDHHSMPLELRRTTKDAAWHVPFQYQYHLNDVTYARPSQSETRMPF